MSFDTFFTPIELENGLVSPSKVEQLVPLIQHDYIQNGKEEMLSHWSTVAKVLSVTQCSDSLRNFVQFGGLKELYRWLCVAQVEVNDNEKCVDDLIINVLDALRKLPLDEEGMGVCRIRKTVAGFHSHKNTEIQSRSESLSAYWRKRNDMDDGSLKDTNKLQNIQGCENIFRKKSCDNYLKLDCQETVAFPAQGVPTESSVKEIHSTPNVQDTLSTCGHLDIEMEFSDQKDTSNERLLQHKIVEDASDCPTSSVDDAHKADDVDALSATIYTQQNHTRTCESKETITDLGNDKVPKGLGAVMHVGDASVTDKSHVEADPMPLPFNVIERKQREALSCTLDNAKYPSRLSGPGDSNTKDKENIGLMVHTSLKYRHVDSPIAIMTEDSPDYWKKIMQHEKKPAKNNDVSTSKMIERETLHSSDDDIASNKINRFNGEGVKHDFGIQAGTENMSCAVKERHEPILLIEKDNLVQMEGKQLEMDLACGVLDALEVARQVAREVEEEVGIYREGSCSPGLKLDMDGEATNLSIADSASVRHLSEAEGNGSCPEENNPETSHSSKEDRGTSFDKEESCSEVEDTRDIELSMPQNKNVFGDQDSSQLTNLAQVIFDLNEEIQMDGADCPQLSPGATASSSHGTKASSPRVADAAVFEKPVGSNAAGLLFGVDLRRGGIATPIMLCSTLSQSTPEKENSFSNEENCFDLNVADGGTTEIGVRAGIHGRREELVVSSNLPSDDSSTEICSKKTREIINLDLNRIGENCQELSSDCPAGYGLQNKASVSSASAGCFDLNDSPFVNEAVNSNGLDLDRPSKIAKLDLAFPPTGGRKTQQEFVHAFSLNGFYPGSTHHESVANQQEELGLLHNPFLGIGSGVPPFFMQMEMKGTTAPRSLPHATPPALEHGGLNLALTIPSGSSCPQVNGVSFMTDPRDTMLGLGLHFQHPPFIMGPTQQGTNGVDILHPNIIDLNAVVMPMESGEMSGIGNLFFRGSGTSVEDRLKSVQQISGPGPSMKAKELCFSLEPYQLGYKRT